MASPDESELGSESEEAEASEEPKGQRAHPAKPERIQYIAQLMAQGEWVTGVTGPELAAQWGLSLKTVEGDSAEASRRVREQVSNDEELRAQIVATLQTITKRAMKKNQLRTAVESVKTLAGVSGASAPKKVEVGGSLAEILALGLGAGGTKPDSEVGE